MGFPVGYTDLFFPKLLIHTLTLLGLIRQLISASLHFLGLGDFLDPPDLSYPPRPGCSSEFSSVSAALIRELLPVVKYSELTEEEEEEEAAERCAVCLYEFERCDEIRRLTNCRHIFHRSCVDRWIDHDQNTCPLCRTHLVPSDLQEGFNERLWAASGISDYYGDYSPTNTSL